MTTDQSLYIFLGFVAKILLNKMNIVKIQPIALETKIYFYTINNRVITAVTYTYVNVEALHFQLYRFHNHV